LAVIYPASRDWLRDRILMAPYSCRGAPADNLVAVAVAALIRNFATFDGPSDSEA
jgi:hypothetical protein